MPVRAEEAEFILDFMASGLTVYLFRLSEMPEVDTERVGQHLYRFIRSSVASAI